MSINWLDKGRSGFYGKAMTIGIIQGLKDQAASTPGLLLVDSGLEGAFAKKCLQAAIADPTIGFDGTASARLAVINTHSHADHIGGNGYLQRTYQSEVFTSEKEKPYIEYPHLESHYLYGAEPITSLKTKFFCAEPSLSPVAIKMDQRTQPFEWCGRQLTLVDLKGHSPGMIGVLDESGFLYLGDTVFTQETIDKHKLLFVHDVLAWLDTLTFLESLPATGFVLTHGGYYDSVESLVIGTRRSLIHIQELIYDRLRTPMEEGQLHQALAEALALTETVPGYYLNHGAIRAHLSALMSTGQIDATVNKGRLTYGIT